MKITQHRKFIEELRKHLTTDDQTSKRTTNNDNIVSDHDECDEEIMKELERKFDELFGPLSDDE